MARPATPPTTPPAIAPVLDEDDEVFAASAVGESCPVLVADALVAEVIVLTIVDDGKGVLVLAVDG